MKIGIKIDQFKKIIDCYLIDFSSDDKDQMIKRFERGDKLGAIKSAIKIESSSAKFLAAILELLARNERVDLMREIIRSEPILHYWVLRGKHDDFCLVLNAIPRGSRLGFVMQKCEVYSRYIPPLPHSVVELTRFCEQALYSILKMLPKKKRLEILISKYGEIFGSLMEYISTRVVHQILTDLLDDDERLLVLEATVNSPNLLLKLYSGDEDIFKLLLLSYSRCLPEEKRLNRLSTWIVNEWGCCKIGIVDYGVSFLALINFIPVKDRLAFLSIRLFDNKVIFSRVTENRYLFKAITNLIDADAFYNLIRWEYEHGNAFLHEMGGDDWLICDVIKSIPEAARIEVLMQKNSEGISLIDCFTPDRVVMRKVFEVVSRKELLGRLSASHVWRQFVRHEEMAFRFWRPENENKTMDNQNDSGRILVP